MDELIPCPLCGSPVAIKELHIGRVYGGDCRQDFSARIECSCGLSYEHEWIMRNGVPIFNTEHIVTAWNKRPSMTINLNEVVKVKLTDHGKDIYYHHLDDVIEMINRRGGKPLERHMPKVDEDGYTEFQLWYLMRLYGPHIGMGIPQPFDLNIVYEEGQR